MERLGWEHVKLSGREICQFHIYVLVILVPISHLCQKINREISIRGRLGNESSYLIRAEDKVRHSSKINKGGGNGRREP